MDGNRAMSDTGGPRRRLRVGLACCLAAASAAWAGRGAGEPLTDFHRQWVWSDLGLAAGLDGFEVADLDGDGRPELVAAQDVSEDGWTAVTGYWTAFSLGGEVRPLWSSLGYDDRLRAVRLTTEGGASRIVIATRGRIEVVDGVTYQRLRDFPLTVAFVNTIAVGDLDGAPGLEVAVCDEFDLHVHDLATGVLLATKLGFGCTDLEIGQADEDDPLELALAGNPFGTFLLDGASLEIDWADTAVVSGFVRLLQMDADDELEILYALEPATGTVQAVDPTTDTMLWERTNQGFSSMTVAEVSADPGAEILFAREYPAAVWALSATTGTDAWTLPGWTSGARSIAAGDFDLDGQVEVALTLARGTPAPDYLAVVDAATGQIEAESDPIQGGFPGLSITDIDADGGLELVATTTQTLGFPDTVGQVLVFDHSTRELEYSGPPLIPGYGTANSSVVAQLDSDPALEICALLETNLGGPVVTCDDAVTHARQWSVQFAPLNGPVSLLAVEGQDFPFPMVLVGTGRVHAFYGPTGGVFWSSDTLPVPIGALAWLRVGDVDGDGYAEIVAGGDDPFTGGVAVFSLDDGHLEYGPFQFPVSALDLGQLDADEALELAVVSSGALMEVDPTTGQSQPPMAVYPNGACALRIGDLDRDATPDFTLVSEGVLIVRGGAQQADLWSIRLPDDGAAFRDRLWVGDFDHDSVPEILSDTGAGFAIFEAPLFSVFTDGFESGDTSAWSETLP
jgi:outer membrane protein assembly factor BamB